jgi:hypothetical protein
VTEVFVKQPQIKDNVCGLSFRQWPNFSVDFADIIGQGWAALAVTWQ